MRYSDDFERLFVMSLDANLRTEVKYKRVAIFLGRIWMAEELTSNDPLKLVKATHAWMEGCYKKKDDVLSLVGRLGDTEWEMVREAMIDYGNKSPGRNRLHHKRLEWIRALDTLRAFESA